LLHAQAVAREINPAPLEHPQSLVTIRTRGPSKLFSRIQDSVRSAGFEISRVDATRFLLDARRPGAPTKDFDRILVWLEWTPQEPLKSVDLYLLYGRYEEIWTQEGKGTHRVVVDQSFEDEHVGQVRQALIQLTNSK